MDSEELVKELGGFGRYQIVQFLLLCVIYMIPAMQNFSSVFTADIPSMFCREHNQTKYICDRIKNITVTPLTTSLNTTPSSQPTNISIACSLYQFDQTVFSSTIVSHYNLICSNAYLVAMSTTIYMGGFLIGSSVFGGLSDYFGRLKILVVCGTLSAVAGIFAPLTPSFWLYSMLRFIVGLGISGLVGVTFTLAIENVSAANRTLVGILLNFGWCTGILVLSGLSYLIRNHTHLEIIIAIPSLFTVVLYFIIKESPRWLIVTNRFKAAQRSCRAIAAFNGIPSEQLVITNSLCAVKNVTDDDSEATDETESISISMLDLFRTPGLRKLTMVIWFQFFVVSLVYYGVSLGVDNLAGGVHINTVIGALLEFPGYAAGTYLAKRFGRIKLLMVCYAISGAACLICGGLLGQGGLEIIVTCTSMTGRVFIGIGFVVLFLYAGEASPTCIRNTFVGSASTWARIGGMIAPQIKSLDALWPPLPYMVYGVLPVASFVSCFFLPETNNKPSPDTMEDGERFVQGLSPIKPKRPSFSLHTNFEEGLYLTDGVTLKV